MLTALWSVKGGVGVSVTSAMLAVTAARSGPCLLVDAGGDQPAVLGTTDPANATLGHWVRSPTDIGIDSLRRVEHVVSDSLNLLMVGALSGSVAGAVGADGSSVDESCPTDRFRVAARLLAQPDRTVIVDLGNLGSDDPQSTSAAAFARSILDVADQSLLVTTSCYLALRRAQHHAELPTGVVLVDQPERALRRADVESALPAPVVCTIGHSAAVARTVDAGLLVSRLPSGPRRAINRYLEAAAT